MSGPVTDLLRNWSDGDEAARNRLIPLVYDDLRRLAQCRVVELRYFGSFTVEETAQALEISPATVKLDWNPARAWLFRELSRR